MRIRVPPPTSLETYLLLSYLFPSYLIVSLSCLTLRDDVSDQRIRVLVFSVAAVAKKVLELLLRFPFQARHVGEGLVDGIRRPLQERARQLRLLGSVGRAAWFGSTNQITSNQINQVKSRARAEQRQAKPGGDGVTAKAHLRPFKSDPLDIHTIETSRKRGRAAAKNMRDVRGPETRRMDTPPYADQTAYASRGNRHGRNMRWVNYRLMLFLHG